ncbi:MAG: hypothetical protein HN768_08695, partial [Rhodospirillaceae bacterium]|nr:hypothetical protein [Rhodospirillaceae bacterium]
MSEIEAFIAKLPKVELHLHIEGTFEPELMLEIAERNGLPAPFPSVEAAHRAYRFDDLQSFLDLYYRGMNVLLKAEDFRDLALAYFARAHADNVRHAELFFDPQAHTDRGVALDSVFEGIAEGSAPGFTRGKVRDILDLGDRLLISTSDRISAFDVVLSTIPCKGEVLNGLSNHWFGCTGDIIANHIEEKVSPRSVIVKKCDVLPVEVVVRGYLTGSAWRDYEAGKGVSGIQLPAGMRFNQRFDTP